MSRHDKMSKPRKRELAETEGWERIAYKLEARERIDWNYGAFNHEEIEFLVGQAEKRKKHRAQNEDAIKRVDIALFHYTAPVEPTQGQLARRFGVSVALVQKSLQEFPTARDAYEAMGWDYDETLRVWGSIRYVER